MLPKQTIVDSPCINVCQMDEESGLCCACFRTLDEIAAWARSPAADRRAILVAIKQRWRAMTLADDNYLCVGVCMADPDSGYCLGCGRPPLPVSALDQGIVTEAHVQSAIPANTSDPDLSAPDLSIPDSPQLPGAGERS